MYIYHFDDKKPKDYFSEIRSADEIIYSSGLNQKNIDDFMHIYACGVHFLSEFDIEFDRKNIEDIFMGYFEYSKIKFCIFVMENNKKWLISTVFCEYLQQFPYDPFYDKTRLSSDHGYVSYKTAYQSACTIFS